MAAGETVVLDSSNLSAIIQDATGEPLAEPEKPSEPEKPRVEAKPEKAEKPADKPSETDTEGLTEDERKTYTEKMRKSVAWRHGKMREAQEQAARERQGRIAAEERATAIQRELEQLRAGEPAKVEPKADAKPRPKAEDFENQDAYLEALADWKTEQKLAQRDAEEKQRREQSERERIMQGARERIARAIELVPDFAEVTGSVDLNVPAHIAGYMQESELFAELGYFFAQHPDELERLSKLRPDRSLVALGKIESTLQPFAAPSQAAAKVEPNGGSSKPSTAADGIPSRPRVSVPVIQPLNARGAPEVEPSEGTMNGRQAVSSFEKRTGANLSRRSRH